MDSKIVEKCRKLKVLSELGVDGERENAERLLDKVMLKYGILAADLEDDKDWVIVRYVNKFDMNLIVQVFSKITKHSVTVKWIKGKRIVAYELTKEQEKEFRSLLHIYRTAWNKMAKQKLDTLFTAFVQTNSIVPEFHDQDRGEVAESDVYEARRVMREMMDMDVISTAVQLLLKK